MSKVHGFTDLLHIVITTLVASWITKPSPTHLPLAKLPPDKVTPENLSLLLYTYPREIGSTACHKQRFDGKKQRLNKN